MDIIARIKHKLAYLQAHDDGDVTEANRERQWQIQRHYPYQVSLRHTEGEIAAFEAENKIRLPEDYRAFIIHIGLKGFAPHSIFSPIEDMYPYQETLDHYSSLKLNNQTTDIDLHHDDKACFGNLQQSFHLNSIFSTIFYQQDDDFSKWLNGHLPIAYTGCQCRYVLVITGKARGQIWFADGHFLVPVMHRNGELFHANRNLLRALSGHRVTFTQWYEAWLNKQISIAQDHWRKRGRSVPLLQIDEEN